MDPDVVLVRALVRGEPDVSIDPRDRSAERLRVADEVRAELLEPRARVADETDRGLLDDLLVPLLVRREPFLVVVLAEFPEEPEQFGREVPRSLRHRRWPPLALNPEMHLSG